MGGAGSKCCGSSGAIAKAKEDKYIDEIEYEKLGVPSIDDGFEAAFDMLATVISVNNAMVQTVETVKLVGAVLMGAMKTELAVNESSVKFVIVKEPDEGDKTIPVAEVIGGTGAETTAVKSEPDFKKVTDSKETLDAVEACSAALGKLNDALKEASMVGVSVDKNNRLKYVAGDVTDDAAKKQLKDAKLAIQGFNNTFFSVKYQLVQQELKGDGLGKALAEMITKIKGLVSDMKPSLSVDFEKLMDGTLAVTPDLGVSHSKIANVAPKKIKTVLDALFGEKFLTTGDFMSDGGLLCTLVDTAKQCAELMTKFNEAKDGITALASDPTSIISSAEEAGFGKMEAMKMPGKVAANVKTAMKTPLILADCFKTIKDVCGEMKTGLTGS